MIGGGASTPPGVAPDDAPRGLSPAACTALATSARTGARSYGRPSLDDLVRDDPTTDVHRIVGVPHPSSAQGQTVGRSVPGGMCRVPHRRSASPRQRARGSRLGSPTSPVVAANNRPRRDSVPHPNGEPQRALMPPPQEQLRERIHIIVVCALREHRQLLDEVVPAVRSVGRQVLRPRPRAW